MEQAAVSFFIGAPLAINIVPADRQEYKTYPDLFDQLVQATGHKPRAVIGDRGYSVKDVFQHNTENGVESVISWRKQKTIKSRDHMDKDEFDRHGIPRCRHCGGPGDIESPGLGFYRARGKPRLRFRCQIRATADCSKTQTISCSVEWRLLGPLSRRTERYHALKKGGKNLERVFRHWRERYTVGGNNADTRPKRAGITWQNLRAQTALLIEWFRLCLRHGWLGAHRRRNTATPYRQRGQNHLRNTLFKRAWEGIDLPYGKYAVKAGLAQGLAGPAPPPKT
jgi:hypothetical protein